MRMVTVQYQGLPVVLTVAEPLDDGLSNVTLLPERVCIGQVEQEGESFDAYAHAAWNTFATLEAACVMLLQEYSSASQ